MLNKYDIILTIIIVIVIILIIIALVVILFIMVNKNSVQGIWTLSNPEEFDIDYSYLIIDKDNVYYSVVKDSKLKMNTYTIGRQNKGNIEILDSKVIKNINHKKSNNGMDFFINNSSSYMGLYEKLNK